MEIDSFDMFDTLFMRKRFPSVNSQVEHLWCTLKQDMESKQTITAYSITFRVICQLAQKDPENVESKRRFINGLYSGEVRRVLKTLILEEVTIEALTKRGESITISKLCDD